jgi:excinuclease ABC subunit A
MDLKELAASFGLKTLDERDDLPIYGRWRRYHVRRANAGFDQLRLQVHDKDELDTPAFRSFLKDAVLAYLQKVAETARDPDKAQPWKTSGKQWHLSQRAIRPGKKRLWKPPDLLAIVALINKAVPGLDWDWNRKVLIGFRHRGKEWGGRIVTNHPHAMRIEIQTAKNLFTPTQVERLGDDVQIVRDRIEYDTIRFWLRNKAQTDTKLLTEVLRQAADSLTKPSQEIT